jgi:DNA-binding transcriptional LysR family regulator
MRLHLRHLEIIRTVAKAGSEAAAARLLNVSQPAVSRMLRQVETELGFALFKREHGRLSVTNEARALLPEVTKVFDAFETTLRLAGDIGAGRTGMVTIAATPTLATSILPHAIRRFRETRERVQLVIHTLPNHEVIDRVASVRADIGLVLVPPRDTMVESRDLGAVDLVCVLPAGHALSALPALNIAQLADSPLISFNGSRPIGALVESAFAQAGHKRTIDIEVAHSATACALVRAGLGIAILDRFALMDDQFPSLETRPLVPGLQVIARLLQPRDRPLSRLTEMFVADLDVVVQDLIARGVIYASQG